MAERHRVGNGVAACAALALVACASHHLGEGDADGAGGRGPADAGIEAEVDSGARATGARASAQLDPLEAARGDAAPVRAMATFTSTGRGVDLVITIHGCDSALPYPVFIKQGADCSAATLRGADWGGARGEDIPGLSCTGNTDYGRVYYTRPKDHEHAWTIGAPATSDVVGHAMVVADPNTFEPIACGVVTREAPKPADPGLPQGDAPPVELGAQLAGLCAARMIVRDSAHACPDPGEIVACASRHCDLNACMRECSDYLACLEDEPDPCAAASTCPYNDACAQCQSDVTLCTFGFCSEELACAAPVTPGGPCSKLEACCAMQGDGAPSCLETVRLLARFSGDTSCFGAMMDWDFISHLTVPCNFE